MVKYRAKTVDIPQQIWDKYTQIVFLNHYIQLYEQHTARINTGINIFLALSSLYGIASWAIWNNMQWLWGIIIAGAQITSTVYHQYSLSVKREIVCPFFIRELTDLEDDTAEMWNNICEGKIHKDNIGECLASICRKYSSICEKYDNNKLFPKKKKLKKWADASTKDYLESQGGR